MSSAAQPPPLNEAACASIASSNGFQMASMHLCIASSHAAQLFWSSKLEEPGLADLTTSRKESDSTRAKICISPRLEALLSTSGVVEPEAAELAPHPITLDQPADVVTGVGWRTSHFTSSCASQNAGTALLSKVAL